MANASTLKRSKNNGTRGPNTLKCKGGGSVLVLKTTYDVEVLARGVKKLLSDKLIEQLVRAAISNIENGNNTSDKSEKTEARHE